jgi:elongation factor Ts
MANYTAADVKRLREQTGAGMMDCKNALVEANGDFEAAIEALRLKGVKDAGKRAQRTAGNGLIIARLDGNSAGVLLELNCETDFVAKTDLFQQAATDIATAALAAGPAGAADRLAVLGLEVRPGQITQELIEEAGVALKEKLQLGRYARFDGGYISSYLHKSSRDLPPTQGVLVQLDKADPDIAQEMAFQVAAAEPRYVTRDQVPEDVLANERRIAEQITRDEGKPEQAIPRIVENRVNSFLKEIVLVEQLSVREEHKKKTVGQLLTEHGARVTGFARFKIGQAG